MEKYGTILIGKTRHRLIALMAKQSGQQTIEIYLDRRFDERSMNDRAIVPSAAWQRLSCGCVARR